MQGVHVPSSVPEQRPAQQLCSTLLWQRQVWARRLSSRCASTSRSSTAAAPSSIEQLVASAQTLERWQLLEPLLAPAAPEGDAGSMHSADLPLDGCEAGGPRLRVALLLSGGVDSSLALRLVSAAGHAVTAFYLQIWFQEDYANFWDACPWEDDLAVCQQVCEAAGVELRVVPLTEQYWQRVVSHCLAEIRAGRTPNPDMLCNSRVKFGAFYEYLQEGGHGAAFDRIASGHYARVLRDGDGSQVRLALTPDAIKDQTYFLAHLSQPQLARTMFPLGPLTKAEVRRWATALGLPNQARPDSQGICFLGKVRFSDFVQRHLGTWPGAFLEQETGELVGYHEGFWFYTLGQRKGICLSGGPWYVSGKDTDANVVYVSRQYFEADKKRDSFCCREFSWNSDLRPLPCQPLFCKVRHGPTLYRCSLEFSADGSGEVVLEGNDQGLAAGQYVCFYQDSICLGAAVIC